MAFDPCHNDIRHFRVDKMTDVELVDKKRKGITRYRRRNKAKYTQQHFRMYGGELQTVTLFCKNDMSNVIVDQFGHKCRMIPVDEGHFTVDVEVAVSDQFYGWVVGTGGGVRIQGPDDVKAEMRKRIRQYLK